MERKKFLIEIPKLQGNAYTGSFRFMDTSPKPVSSQAQTVFCHGNCWKNPVPPVSEDEQAIWTRKIFNFPPGLCLTQDEIPSGVRLLLQPSV